MDSRATRRAFLLAASGLTLSSCVPKASSVRPATDLRVDAVDSLLRVLTRLAMFNGTVMIDRAGELAFNRSYGFADYESRVAFSSNTRFKIASISKQMTDAALASMLTRGLLRFDDRLARYMPDFPGADRITIELITQHRSGIPHTNNQPWGDGSTILSHDEILARLASLPLNFEPGAERRYSNGGYAVLARVMEMASGRSYAQFMRELVFEPLGMRDSGAITDSHARLPGLAQGYQPGERIGERQRSRFYAVETRPGGGSLYASAADVLHFFQSAWRARLPGADVYTSLFGGTGATRAADGRSPGQYMDIHFVRDADLIVSSTANNYAAEFKWAENLARIALGDSPLFTSLPAIDPAGRALANDPWIGRYREEGSTADFDHEIARTDEGALILSDRDGNSRALIPLRDGRYLDPLYYSVCRSDAVEAGRVVAGRLYEGGYTKAWSRISTPP
jgi:CubicO group peptidase (beta-lactamase class C family)